VAHRANHTTWALAAVHSVDENTARCVLPNATTIVEVHISAHRKRRFTLIVGAASA